MSETRVGNHKTGMSEDGHGRQSKQLIPAIENIFINHIDLLKNKMLVKYYMSKTHTI